MLNHLFPTAYLPYLDGLVVLVVLAIVSAVWSLFKRKPKN
jgi:hypothetical protein